jgi:hypothetical protein
VMSEGQADSLIVRFGLCGCSEGDAPETCWSEG